MVYTFQVVTDNETKVTSSYWTSLEEIQKFLRTQRHATQINAFLYERGSGNGYHRYQILELRKES